MKVPIIGPALSVGKGLVWGILSSLKLTLLAIVAALRLQSLSILVALLKEGSPLESLIDDLLTLVFWVLILAPVILVPIYYLGLSLMP